MKVALCVQDVQHVIDCLDKKTDYIVTKFIDREICEHFDEEYPAYQVIPTFTLVSTNGNEFKVLSYQRQNNITEKRLQSKRSITIGGHIDSISDFSMSINNRLLDFFQKFKNLEIHSDSMVTPQDLHFRPAFRMDREEFMGCLLLSLRREISEELGYDFLEELDKHVSEKDIVFNPIYMDNSDVNRVHVGVNACINVEDDIFEKLIKIAIVCAKEIYSLNRYKIHKDIAKEIYLEILNRESQHQPMKDPRETFKAILRDVLEEENFEDWSVYLLCDYIDKYTRQ